jgi:hypothetical protein
MIMSFIFKYFVVFYCSVRRHICPTISGDVRSGCWSSGCA